jgi:hypothetical protein
MLVRALSIAGLLCLSSCLPPPNLPPMTPEQAAWFSGRDSQPLAFEIPAEEGAIAWSRAKVWIASCGDFKLQTLDENLLETYYPTGEAAVRFGYQVTRLQTASGWRIGVRAVTGNQFARQLADRAAATLAYYVRTGQDCPSCGCGRLGQPNRL